MGLFSKIVSKATKQDDEKVHVQTYGFVGQDGLTNEHVQHLQAAFLTALESDDASQQWNAAARLLTGQQYQEAIAAYQELGGRYPDRKSDALSQVGAARYFLGEYEAAIDDYVAARDLGFDADMIDDNVWEACEALHGKGDPSAGQRYLTVCPQGRYAKKAARL